MGEQGINPAPEFHLSRLWESGDVNMGSENQWANPATSRLVGGDACGIARCIV
jgi:hypothetical protein